MKVRISGSLLLLATPLLAQPGPMAVRYTEAISESVRGTVELNGTIESRGASTIASEVAGIVSRLHVREGDFVTTGNPIASLRSEDLRLQRQASEGALLEANARLELARASLSRARGMWEDQIISRQQYDDAVSEEQAWLGRVASTRANLERIKRDLERATIRAPFSGVLTQERVAVGEWVSAGGEIADLLDTSTLEVDVDVPEKHYGSISRGDTVMVTLPALDELRVAGSIRAIIPRSDTSSRTFPVKISIDSNGSIGVGMRARVALPVGSERSAVLVPKDAIVRQGPSQMIYVIADGNTVSAVPVTTGESAGVWVEIAGDVDPGAQVVTRGNERMRPGQQVAGQPLEYPFP